MAIARRQFKSIACNKLPIPEEKKEEDCKLPSLELKEEDDEDNVQIVVSIKDIKTMKAVERKGD